MATRSSWKGYLQLSLVCVPIKAYTTSSSQGDEIHLHQLHADCHSRIQYKKVCPQHGEVTAEQIVSGYEYSKGRYVVVDPDELDRLRTEAQKAIQIDAFIPSKAFDPLYATGKRYYLAPDGPRGKRPMRSSIRPWWPRTAMASPRWSCTDASNWSCCGPGKDCWSWRASITSTK